MHKGKFRIEKVVIKHDYTSELALLDTELQPEDKALVRRALAIYECQKELPFVTDREAAAEFDRMVEACDEMMKEFSGKLTAVVDYESHEASITMECVYVEFIIGEFMDTLLELVATATQIRFEPTVKDYLRISIDMPYFFPA